MAFVLMDSGATAEALVKLGKNSFSQWWVRLFNVNHVPTTTDTLASYPLRNSAWETTVDNTSWNGSASGGQWVGVANPLVFTLPSGDAGQIIYGYLIRDSTPQILGAELYSAPYTIPTGGGVWSVALQDTFHG